MSAGEQREAFRLAFNVSRETLAKFDLYAGMLEEWQAKMNLVAPSTLPHLWERHFHDSAQLYELIPPKAGSLIDIGSGGGFPGMVMGLMAEASNRPLGIHLIEATRKKTDFLRALAEALRIDVTIHGCRAETITDLRADVITARALAPLPELLKLCARFTRPETIILLPKGAKAQEELTAARKTWHFECEPVASRTGDSGRILIIRHLRHHKQAARHGQYAGKNAAARKLKRR